MNKIFITYGNTNYQQSKQRIIKEANSLDIFDKVIAYGPEDLSEKIINDPLFKYGKGGGYWIWKSYIIKKTLQTMNDGDILIYADAGCSLLQSNQWDKYFSDLKKHSILVFKINCLNYQYIKSKVVNEFKRTNGKKWHYSYQVAGGILFFRKDKFSTLFVDEWCNCCTEDFILDVPPQDIILEDKRFIEHRHDQAVLTALIYKYLHTNNIKLRWNDFEAKRKGQAIRATRISDTGKRSSEKENKLKNLIRYTLVLPMRDIKQQFWTIFNKI